jgi:hypothetical protein
MCFPVLLLNFRPVAALPASCYLPARCHDMDRRTEARSRRVDDAANSSRRVFPPACTEVTAAAERVYAGRTKVACAGGGAAIERPLTVEGTRRAQGHPGPRAYKLLDTPCRVIFDLTHSKQRKGVTIKCHAFRRSGLPVSCAKMKGGRAWEIGLRVSAAPRQHRNRGQKIKREANAKGIHLPGWVGFVAETQ